MRFDDKNKAVILANFGGDTEIRLDVARYGISAMKSDSGEEYSANDGIFYIKMPKNCAKVLFCN